MTGSGKTEIYLQVMRRVLEQSPQNQVLLLVPEINLTPQLEERVRSHFADESVVVLNSDLPDAQRARSWLAVHEGRARILVGTRMAALASFRQLALIVVDEEHDLSYKGGDGARYSARDLSVKRARVSVSRSFWGLPRRHLKAGPAREAEATGFSRCPIRRFPKRSRRGFVLSIQGR